MVKKLIQIPNCGKVSSSKTRSLNLYLSPRRLTSVTVIRSCGSSVSIRETRFLADSDMPVQLDEVIAAFPKTRFDENEI